MSEHLKDKAEEAVESRRELSSIRLDLKNKYPETKYPYWVAEYIRSTVYFGGSVSSISRMTGKSRNTIYKHIDDNIKEYIEELKNKELYQYEQKVYSLVDSALGVYEDLLEAADTDATRLKAAETILKKFGIVEEKSKVELSGAIDIPVIKIINE